MLDRHGGKLETKEISFLLTISESAYNQLSRKQAEWLSNLVLLVPRRRERRDRLLAFRNRLERRIEMIDARLAEVED